MIPIAEMLPWAPTPLWKIAVQAGATRAVGHFRVTADSGVSLPERPWELPHLRDLQERFAAAGLELAVMECSPPMKKIRPGLPGQDEEIPCYSSVGRLLAIGYITGLQEAVYGKKAAAGAGPLSLPPVGARPA